MNMRLRTPGGFSTRCLTLMFGIFGVIGLSTTASAAGFCSQTADLLWRGCMAESNDDYWVTLAKCVNVANPGDRAACQQTAQDDRVDAQLLCDEQLALRVATCAKTGEVRYDPSLKPSDFDTDFNNPTNPNPYFPLSIGSRWEYSAGSEYDVVEVLDEYKLIEGVTCVVVRDVVTDGGEVVEDTDDWFAQAKAGDVWYFGEEVKNYQTFPGDVPAIPELVDVDGSFKHGRERDKAGLIFPFTPSLGQSYVEEFSLGNAEDVATVLSTSYAYGNDPGLDELVPQPLAELLCASGDCIVTRSFSLLEPGVSARKYYARNVGFFLEVESTGEVVSLVFCNVDPICAQLP